VLCRDDLHRFLPLAAADVTSDAIDIASPLLLLEDDELAFYVRKGRSLSGLRRTPVVRGEVALGGLKDLLLADDGAIEAVIVEHEGSSERIVPFDSSVRLGAGRRRLPAA
ncbi:MAG: hypothetical protein QOE36_636, partial [Gaiellaceae bacterium]|nr:hypothetical protein [Gaiellaceae bacterium]